MHRRVVLFLLLLIPLKPSFAEEPGVVVERNNCYPGLYKIFCRGAVRNESGKDLEQLIITFSSPYLKLHVPQIDSDAYDEIPFLPADETADFVVVWDASSFSDKIDPDVLRGYILTAVKNGTMGIHLKWKQED